MPLCQSLGSLKTIRHPSFNTPASTRDTGGLFLIRYTVPRLPPRGGLSNCEDETGGDKKRKRKTPSRSFIPPHASRITAQLRLDYINVLFTQPSLVCMRQTHSPPSAVPARGIMEARNLVILCQD